jgi:hypothetical protein
VSDREDRNPTGRPAPLSDDLDFQVALRYAQREEPEPEPEPERPAPPLSDEDVRDAVDVLLGPEGLGNFNFVDQVDRGGALALLLLPHVRALGVRFDDGTPLHWIEAPQQGVGKTSLARLCTGADGVPYSRVEWKRSQVINAALTSRGQGDTLHGGVVFFDNVHEKVESSALAVALTNRQVEPGPGGRTRTLIWVMTVQPGTSGSEDFVGPRGRAVKVRLTGEPPEGRLPLVFSLDPAVRESARAALDEACRTLVGAWDQAGRPERAGPYSTRWRRWEAVMGGLLDLVTADDSGMTDARVLFLGAEGARRGPSRTGDPLVDAFSDLYGTERRSTKELFRDERFSVVARPLCRSWNELGLSQLLQHRVKAGKLAKEGTRPTVWWVRQDA